MTRPTIPRSVVVAILVAVLAGACSGTGTPVNGDGTAADDPGVGSETVEGAATADGDGTDEATTAGDRSTEAATDDAATDDAATGPAADDGAAQGGESAPLFDIDAVLAADPDCPDPVQGEPLIVGYAADLSEVAAFADGPGSRTAIHMADLINCSGGLAGRPVQVTVADVSGADPLVTRDGTLALLDGGAAVLLGPPFPDPGFRILEATMGRVPVLFTGSTEPALGDESNLSYLVAYSDTQGATAAAQFAQSQGWSSAVTFSTPGPYFGYHGQVFATAFTNLGGTVEADYDFVPLEQTDFSEAVADMAADPPDVIYSAMLANQWVALRGELDDAGLTGVQLIGTDAFEASNGYALTGTEGIYHVTHTDPRPGTRVETLIGSFADANGGVPPASSSMAALAGDAMAVIAEAHLRSGTIEPEELGRAIGTVSDVQGISGVLTYERSGFPDKPMYVHQVVDGQATLAAVIGR